VSRSWLLYLDDLIESAEKIGRLTAGRTFSTFASDEAAFDAVLFNMEVADAVQLVFPLPADSPCVSLSAKSGRSLPRPLTLAAFLERYQHRLASRLSRHQQRNA